ncbi:hypothetical protein BGX28_000339, partial [Mortierella sp. GBA30]
ANSGQCCSLALFNFLANQEPVSQSDTVKAILKRSRTEDGEYDCFAADQDATLRSLHHWLLTDRDTYQPDLEEGLDDNGEYDEPQPSGNHMIVILPFAGHVWEIDSYHWNGPECLGEIEHDWTHVAQKRLQLWTQAAIESRICNDIHAIVGE